MIWWEKNNLLELLKGDLTLEKRNSKFNGEIQVTKSLAWGTTIQVAGLTQSGGIVEKIWKPVLKKIKAKENPIHNSLILGLGGGSAAKIIKKLWPEAEITGVEIDSIMVELGAKYLALNSNGEKIIIQDALKFCEKCISKYDLIIVDTYHGDQFPTKFESDRFLNLILKMTTERGTVVFNRLYYGEKRPPAVKFGQKLEKTFKKVDWFYPEANLMFICQKCN